MVDETTFDLAFVRIFHLLTAQGAMEMLDIDAYSQQATLLYMGEEFVIRATDEGVLMKML